VHQVFHECKGKHPDEKKQNDEPQRERRMCGAPIKQCGRVCRKNDQWHGNVRSAQFFQNRALEKNLGATVFGVYIFCHTAKLRTMKEQAMNKIIK
jgi:hypothetical protein